MVGLPLTTRCSEIERQQARGKKQDLASPSFHASCILHLASGRIGPGQVCGSAGGER